MHVGQMRQLATSGYHCPVPSSGNQTKTYWFWIYDLLENSHSECGQSAFTLAKHLQTVTTFFRAQVLWEAQFPHSSKSQAKDHVPQNQAVLSENTAT